jgi:hypothetical protein
VRTGYAKVPAINVAPQHQHRAAQSAHSNVINATTNLLTNLAVTRTTLKHAACTGNAKAPSHHNLQITLWCWLFDAR